MPFEKILEKIHGRKEIVSKKDFQTRLDNLILVVEQKYSHSVAAEKDEEKIYQEKLANLDFKGSKQALEEGRDQLVKSLDFDIQLEFLKEIKMLSKRLIPQIFANPEDLQEFNKIAQKILDLKKSSSRFQQRLVLKQIQKFLSASDEKLSPNHVSTDISSDDIEKVLLEVKEGMENSDSVDNEVDKIINEIRKKSERG
ncbi:MAG: hypothetical protein ACXAC8_04075 [Candidatus Hodarchaeales archaeon]|jgi:hypothetical protein